MWAFPLADAPKDEARASIPRALTDEDEAVTVEAMARFGDDLRAWAFVCPSCGDIADGRDFSEALAATPRMNDGRLLDASDLLGKECIGRTLGALKTAEDKPKRGCGHAAYGLLASTPDGCPRWVFPLADTPKERA
jgi:hypothetical protein